MRAGNIPSPSGDLYGWMVPMAQSTRCSVNIIHMPNVMAEYNEYMAVVDLHDNGVAECRVVVHEKNWWLIPFQANNKGRIVGP